MIQKHILIFQSFSESYFKFMFINLFQKVNKRGVKMINLIYDIDGCKVGVYDGDNDSASIYDCAGHYLGKYFEHEIFNKEGMCLGFHNGNPLETLKILVLDYLVRNQ